MTTDVHTEHCCSKHGCKYNGPGITDCTVMMGYLPQSYPCEWCDMDREQVALWLPEATEEELLAELRRRGLDWGPYPVA